MGVAQNFVNALSFSTVRYATIRHPGIGVAYVFGCLIIALYLGGIEILLNGKHLDKRQVHGQVKFVTASPWLNNNRCFHKGCRHTFTEDAHLPYCERFTKLKEDDTSYRPVNVSKRPCVLWDARDLQVGLWEESTIAVPTALKHYQQSLGCPKNLKPESGFGVSHSSYSCNKEYSEVTKLEWDGFIIDPERFRLIIMHGVSVDMPGHEDLYFSTSQMEGRYQYCQMKGKKRVCTWKKIPCVHKRCGLASDLEAHANKYGNKQVISALSGSLIQLNQGISGHEKRAVGVAQLRKSQSSPKTSNLKVGFQSHLGFLEFLPNDLKASSSLRNAPSSISQDVAARLRDRKTLGSKEDNHVSSGSHDPNTSHTSLGSEGKEAAKDELQDYPSEVDADDNNEMQGYESEERLNEDERKDSAARKRWKELSGIKRDLSDQGDGKDELMSTDELQEFEEVDDEQYEKAEKRKPWNSLIANIDRRLASTLDLDRTIVQGQYGLLTSVGFLLELAGINSLDDEVGFANDKGTFRPREKGISLEITFEYSNWQRGKLELYPSRIPKYTMIVKMAHPVRFAFKKRSPEMFTFNETKRREIFINGVKIRSLHTGEYNVANFGQLLIVLTSALGLMRGLQFCLDIVSQYGLASSSMIRKYKYEQTEQIQSSLVAAAAGRIQSLEERANVFGVRGSASGLRGHVECVVGLMRMSREIDEDDDASSIDTDRMPSREALGAGLVEGTETSAETNMISNMRAMGDKVREMEAEVARLKKIEVELMRFKEAEAKIARLEARGTS